MSRSTPQARLVTTAERGIGAAHQGGGHGGLAVVQPVRGFAEQRAAEGIDATSSPRNGTRLRWASRIWSCASAGPAPARPPFVKLCATLRPPAAGAGLSGLSSRPASCMVRVLARVRWFHRLPQAAAVTARQSTRCARKSACLPTTPWPCAAQAIHRPAAPRPCAAPARRCAYRCSTSPSREQHGFRRPEAPAHFIKRKIRPRWLGPSARPTNPAQRQGKPAPPGTVCRGSVRNNQAQHGGRNRLMAPQHGSGGLCGGPGRSKAPLAARGRP